MLSPTDLWALVDAKLREHPLDLRPHHHGGDLLYARELLIDELSLDDYRRIAIADVERHNPRKLEEVREPAEPVRIWRYGFPEGLDGKPVDRKLADTIFFRLQRHRDHYITSETWQRELAAIDRSDAWLALAAEHEAAGRLVHANAALAAARWLDPGAAEAAAAIVRDRHVGSLPQQLLEQPQPGYRAQSFKERHALAWDMKCRDRCDVPSLIAYACDENFSVRTRIYRSLGQQPLVASVPVLLEGLLDPHEFARSQAARSLGWIGAPTAFERLQRLAAEDVSAEVRRAAQVAMQRIAGYWTFYGEWKTIVRQPRRVIDVTRQLVAQGLGHVARDVLGFVGLARNMADLLSDTLLGQRLAPLLGEHFLVEVDEVSQAEVEALLKDLQPFILPYPLNRSLDYTDYHFGAAPELEDAIARADPEHEPDPMLALYAVSKQRRSPARAIELVAAPEPLGWNARRALRALSLA